MRSRVALGPVALLLVTACTTTRSLPASSLAPLRAAGSEHPLELVDADGRRLRADPNSAFRFLLADGAWTPWIGARSLKTSELGLTYRDESWAWESVTRGEVQNFSGPKTFALVVGSAVVVATVVTLAAASRGRCCSAGGAAVVHTAARAGYATAALASGGDEPDEPPVEGAVSRQAGDDAAPLFVGAIRRRSTIDIIPWTQTMATFGVGAHLEQSLGASLRFVDVWEVGGFVRATSVPGRAGLQFVGGARLGLHLELDRNHRFSIPVFVELGGGPRVPWQTRLGAGLRVRVADDLRVGLHVPSPTLTRSRRDDGEHVTRWAFPMGLEVAYAF